MPYQNIQGNISDPVQAQILMKVDEIKAFLPFLVNLKKGEKLKGRKLGPKADKFLLDILKTIQVNPIYKPNYVDAAQFEGDMGLYIQLMVVEAAIKGLVESIADTRAALLQELMNPGLAVYKNVQSAALANVPGSDTVLNELRPYFKRGKKKKQAP